MLKIIEIRKPGLDTFAGGILALLLILISGTVTSVVAQGVPSPSNPRPRATPTPQTGGVIPEIVSQDADLDAIGEQIRDEMTDSTADPLADRRNTILSRVSTGSQSSALSLNSSRERVLFYLDLLTRAEQRAEALRRQLFEIIEKGGEITSRIQQLDYNLRPEVVSGFTALSGSLNPDDLREQRRKALEIEKENLQVLQQQIEFSRLGLENSVRRADELVERVRLRFDSVVDIALDEIDDQP